MQEHRTAIFTEPILLNQGGVIPHPFSHKEFEEAAEEFREKTLAKEVRGVFCAQKDSNLRNDEPGHDSTRLSNFIQFQYSTGLDTWNSKIEACKINSPI